MRSSWYSACADQLSRAGYEVTPFDSQPSVGGLLASGVPPFKLDKSILSRRQRMLEKQGVRLWLGAWVDDAMLAQLREQYQTLFVANGTSRPRRLSVPGIGAEGVEDALSCLSRINRDPHRRQELAGKRVLVIGDGDSAIDCARSALREGARRVTLVYRRDASAMRASAKERRAALDEGVRLKTRHVPLEVVTEHRRVRASTPVVTIPVIQTWSSRRLPPGGTGYTARPSGRARPCAVAQHRGRVCENVIWSLSGEAQAGWWSPAQRRNSV